MKNQTIFIASDHGGFKLKKQLTKILTEQKIKLVDLGPEKFNPEDDYPDYALPLAKAVVEHHTLGILICRNGIGVSIAANKIRGVRAGTASSPKSALSMRQDDHTNILCLGADFLNQKSALSIVNAWLNARPNRAKRHLRRIEKIKNAEK